MTRLNVNPTRMELKKLKTRLSTAVRGHKLLKDKSDEMIRRFTVIIKQAKTLRESIEKDVADLFKSFALASALESDATMERAFLMPAFSVSALCDVATVMGVEVPEVTVKGVGQKKLPYAYGEITSEADDSVKKASDLLPKMVELACVEKRVRVLSYEIERNKRRVNALEYVMIPQLEETIKYIKSKLDENERASVIRIMKVKSKTV